MIKFPYYNPVQRQIVAIKLVGRLCRRNAWVAWMVQETGPGPLVWFADWQIGRIQRRILKRLSRTSVTG